MDKLPTELTKEEYDNIIKKNEKYDDKGEYSHYPIYQSRLSYYEDKESELLFLEKFRLKLHRSSNDYIHFIDSNMNYIGVQCTQECCEHFRVDAYLSHFNSMGGATLDMDSLKFIQYGGFGDLKSYLEIKLLGEDGDEIGIIQIENCQNGFYMHSVETGILEFNTKEKYSL